MAVHTLTGRTDSTQNGDDRKEGRRVYAAIDLKSFYASVECRERGLDPLKTLLVVADLSRTEKTICLAVSPSLKAYGIPGRPRLFEVVQAVERINRDRLAKSGLPAFTGSSSDADELRVHPEYRLEYIVARPRMQLYMDYSAKIYQTYLKFVAPEDIFPYSVDEVFIDLTSYRKLSGMDAKALTRRMIREVLKETGITATAGVGTNMYLAKVAMDIVAKHMPADEYGVRMAFCDEIQYRRRLWNHRPLTDFWRVGRGYARKLADHGISTMGDIARTSLVNEELLYHLFGVNAELLIDHAWGWEPCTIADVKNFRPPAKSMSEGQVLQEPYSFAKARLVIGEMADRVALDLTEKHRETSQIVLTVGYDIENLTDPERRKKYRGEITIDRYGREVPRQAHGTIGLAAPTNAQRLIRHAVLQLFDRIVNPDLLVRRMYVVAGRVREVPGSRMAQDSPVYEQMDLFSYAAQKNSSGDALHDGLSQRPQDAEIRERVAAEREAKAQKAIIALQEKYGKNAVIKGMDLEEGATAVERNSQIGGHRA